MTMDETESKALPSALRKLERKLRKKAAKGDDFEVGTVIRWRVSDRYIYAALKVEQGLWYTTSSLRRGVTYPAGSGGSDAGTTAFGVGQRVSFSELSAVLALPEVSDVAVATEWVSIG